MKKSCLILVISIFMSYEAMAEITQTVKAKEQSNVTSTSDHPQLLCEYLISNEWNTGFTGVIQLSNMSERDVEGWQVMWELNANTLTNTWNADITMVELENSSQQYSASSLDWNQIIKVDQTIEFGFQGNKLESDIEMPMVSGEKCKIIKIEQ